VAAIRLETVSGSVSELGWRDAYLNTDCTNADPVGCDLRSRINKESA